MKKLIIAAAAFAAVLTGCIVMGVGFLMTGGNWRELSTDRTVKDTEYIDGYFDSLNVRLSTFDLRIELSRDGKNRAEISRSEKIDVTLEIANGELTVRETDNRRWVDRISFFSFGESRVTLYLTESAYESAYLHLSTGDVFVAEDFTFGELSIRVSTGDVISRARVSGSLTVKGTTGSKTLSGVGSCESIRVDGSTGDVSIRDADCARMQIEGNTSDVELHNITAEDIAIGVNSGDIEMKNVVAKGTLEAKTTTGDIEFDRCDGAEVVLKTTTGDIEGSLLSGKMFDAATTTGNVRVPAGDRTGGGCKAHTTSGDIDITVK